MFRFLIFMPGLSAFAPLVLRFGLLPRKYRSGQEATLRAHGLGEEQLLGSGCMQGTVLLSGCRNCPLSRRPRRVSGFCRNRTI